ncbi:hypothetical protein ACFFRR_002499 [Megaselia abdita]
MKTSIALIVLFIGIAATFKLPHASDRSDIVEGDMLLTPVQKEMLYSESRNGVTDLTLRWPYAVVYYQMDPWIPNEHQWLIINSLAKVEQQTCVRFVIGASPEGHYIRVTNHEAGCWAHIGYLRGQQQLNIGHDCEYEHTVIHEFLHAIGFYHQQSSYERDYYVNIHLENVEPGQEHNFIKYTNQEVTNFNTRYDYDSIMHYYGTAFSKNGLPTMTPKFPEGQYMGTGNVLTQTDIIKINRMYNCY